MTGNQWAQQGSNTSETAGGYAAQPIGAPESAPNTAADGPPAPPVPMDSDLAAVAAAWPSLPAVVRAGIMAMVRAAGGDAA